MDRLWYSIVGGNSMGGTARLLGAIIVVLAVIYLLLGLAAG